MDKNGPFIKLNVDSRCIAKAIRDNNLCYLEGLFERAEFSFSASNQVQDFFLIFSNDDYKYDLPLVEKALTTLAGTLFTPDGDFSPLFGTYLPKGTQVELAQLITHEIERCFNMVFDKSGEIQTWLTHAFAQEQLTNLINQFGETAVKFKLFNIIAIKYCHLFKTELPSDEACSKVIIKLIEYELKGYGQLANSINNLDHTLSQMDKSYKLKKHIVFINQQVKIFFFTNKFLSSPILTLYLTQLCLVIKAPHDAELLKKLRRLEAEIEATTTNNYLLELVGTVCVFLGAFLFVAGILSAPTLPITSLALMPAGLLFFGTGISVFQAGLPLKFSETIDDYSSQAQKLVSKL